MVSYYVCITDIARINASECESDMSCASSLGARFLVHTT